MLSVRERGSSDQRWWSPERDITVVYPAIMRRVFHLLSRGLLVNDEKFHSAALDVSIRLKVDNNEIMSMARGYAKLISCVEARVNPMVALEELKFSHTPCQALVGLLFVQEMTAFFASKYSSTLHKGESDPNLEILSELMAVLNVAQKPLGFWRSLCIRLRLTWAILTCRIAGSGV